MILLHVPNKRVAMAAAVRSIKCVIILSESVGEKLIYVPITLECKCFLTGTSFWKVRWSGVDCRENILSRA